MEGAQAWRLRNPPLTPTMPLAMCAILQKSLNHSEYILNSSSVKEQSRAKRTSKVSHKMLSFIFLANQLCEIKLPRLKKKKSLTTIHAKSDKLKATTHPLSWKCVILYRKIFLFQGNWVRLTPIYWKTKTDPMTVPKSYSLTLWSKHKRLNSEMTNVVSSRSPL